MGKEKLIRFDIMYRPVSDKYEIVAEYLAEEKDGKHKYTYEVPINVSMDLPICSNKVLHEYSYSDINIATGTIDFGFGEINVYSSDPTTIKDELIEPKVKKMTIADIEKELGYKVEIVGERKK